MPDLISLPRTPMRGYPENTETTEFRLPGRACPQLDWGSGTDSAGMTFYETININ
jgi:hypothetical protein